MFKNMKIGTKIILGFSSVLILLVVVGIIAYRSLDGASTGFGQYREMARDTNLAGRIQANMLMVRMNVKDYLITGSETDIKEFEKYWDKMEEFIAEAKKEIIKPELAVKTKAGGVYRDREKLRWVDPFQREVWDYNIAVAKIAAVTLTGFVEDGDLIFPTPVWIGGRPCPGA